MVQPPKAEKKRKVGPRKAPKQERARLKVEQILKAAKSLLVSEGLEKLTTNHIAKAANMSVGSLYQYFPNKQSILHELYIAWLDNTRMRIEPFRKAASNMGVQELIEHMHEAVYSDTGNDQDDALETELAKAMKLYPELQECDRQHGQEVAAMLADILCELDLECSRETALDLGKMIYALDGALSEFQILEGNSGSGRLWLRQAVVSILTPYLPEATTMMGKS